MWLVYLIEFFMFALGAAVLVYFVFAIIRALYWRFDHYGWNPDASPDAEASIADVHSEKVQYTKNGVKYKTTVTFSDGFYYITHRTNREQQILSYTISIDKYLKAEIISRAKKAHEKAVQKS